MEYFDNLRFSLAENIDNLIAATDCQQIFIALTNIDLIDFIYNEWKVKTNLIWME